MNKIQTLKTIQNLYLFRIFEIGNWNLFVIWDLYFGILEMPLWK